MSAEPALVVVDVQQAFDDPSWGTRNNPRCEENIAALIEHWRAHGRPLVFVRHDSDEPGSTLAPDHPGHAFKDLITGEPDLLVALLRDHGAGGRQPRLRRALRATAPSSGGAGSCAPATRGSRSRPSRPPAKRRPRWSG